MSTGRPRTDGSITYTDVFAKTMLELGAKKHDLVAVCAAMASGTGLAEFAKRYPERCFDVGIAEQHAVTMAAALAAAGKRPVVAITAHSSNELTIKLFMTFASKIFR